jgi:ribosomal protein L35AE/L33A
VQFRVCELIDEAARILSTKSRPVKRNQILLEGGKRLAGIIVRSGGNRVAVRRFRQILKALAAVDSR